MRVMRFAFLLFVCAVVLSACVPKSKGSSSSTSDTLIKGGTLRLPFERAQSAGQDFEMDLPQSQGLNRNSKLTLVRSQADGKLLPGLAKSWTTEDGGKTWVFHLDERFDQSLAWEIADTWEFEIRDHSDQAIRAQLADLVTGAAESKLGKAEDISGVKPDGHTFTVKLSRANHQFPLWVSQPSLGLESYFGGQSGHTEISLGFFRSQRDEDHPGLPELTEPVDYKLLKDPEAPYIFGEPLFDKVEYIFEPDRHKQFEMYKAGELDTCNVAPEDLAEVLADPELKKQLHTYDTAATLVGFIDHHAHPWGDAPFKDKTPLRAAANYALYRTEIAENAGGQFEPWPHFLPKALEDFIDPAQVTSPMFRIEPDVDKAKEGLHLAGHDQASLLPTNMLISYVEDPLLATVARSIKDNFDDLSIRMRPYPCKTEEDALQLVKIGSMDIWLQWVYPAYPSPDAFFYPTLHSSLSGLGGNYGRVEEPEIDKLIEQAQAEPDEAARQKLYQQLETEVEKRALFLMLGSDKAHILINPKLAGYELTPYDFDASLPAQDFSKLGFTE